MMFRFICVTTLALRVDAFSSVVVVRRQSLATTTTLATRLAAAAGDGGTDYDEWYQDFDPSAFEQEQSTFDRGSSSSSYNGGRSTFSSSSSSSRTTKPRRGGGGGGGGGYHDYQRDVDADNSNVNLAAVDGLIAERLQCRKTGRFDEADAIRDQLLEEHGVRVLDREKMWRSGCSRSGSGRQWGNNNNNNRNNDRRGPNNTRKPPRDFGPNGHDYQLSRDAGDNTSPLSDAQIHAQIAERLRCKMTRNFRDADAIQGELERAGVYIHDGRKEWRADGERYGDYQLGGRAAAGPGRDFGSSSDRNRPYTPAAESEPTEFETQIQALVDERSEAKRARDFQVADDIRDDLRTLYQVEVNDRLRQWSVGGEFGMPALSDDRRRELSPFRPAPWMDSVPENANDIQSLVEKRDAARQARDFGTADDIRDELLSMNVFVNEKQREWSIGKRQDSFRGDDDDGPRGFTRRGGGTLTPDQVDKIEDMLAKRDEAKRNKQFGKADSIRDDLRDNYLIRIDDRSREWMVVTDEYALSPPDTSIAVEVKSLIESKINERAVAKLNKDYDTADAIRDELEETFNVQIDDRVREWRLLGPISSPPVMDQFHDEEEEYDEEEDEESEESDFAFFASVAETVDQEAAAGVEEEVSEPPKNGEDLESLKVDELKERLREAGLPVSGRKAELIERLMSSI
eukprot:scaffold8005_cov275-Amphora_coffeaeformis.AAC.11